MHFHFPACTIRVYRVGQITNDVLDMPTGPVCQMYLHLMLRKPIENNVNVNSSVVLFYVVLILLLSLLFSFYNDFCVDLLVTTNEN